MNLLAYKLLILAITFQCSQALYPSYGDVVDLTPSNFDKLVLQDDAIWIVEFYAPWCGHCKNLVPEYQKAAKALKGVIKIGAVNADEHRSLGSQYNVQGFPTIKVFGQNKKSPTDFNGQRTAQGIAEVGLAEAKKKVKAILGGGGTGSDNDSGDSKDVVELTDDNFDKLVLSSEDIWLVEFYAPWCGHCKNLAPHWAKAASELKGKVKLGALDATVHQSKAQQYDVSGYPTIKYFAAGTKTPSEVQDYSGGRTASDIVSWALDKYSDSIPAPKLVEIINENSFETACDNKPLCVVSVLPHILDCDAKCRNNYLNILKTMGEKFKKKLWGWTWSEATAQQSLEESLEIGGFGYPAMAIVNFKKMKFSVLKGSFSQEGIEEFLRDISYGRGNTSPVRGAKKPKIITVEPWDGKDGKLPEIEEIDLSDIDLDDKDEL